MFALFERLDRLKRFWRKKTILYRLFDIINKLHRSLWIAKFLSYIPYSFSKLFIKKRQVFKLVLIAQHSLPHEHG